MIFDDHDVHDDWNISEAWVREHARHAVVGRAHHRRVHVVLDLPAHRQPRPAGAGRRSDCSPSSPRTADGGPRLRAFARAIDREPASSRFAFHRDFGRSRLVVIDSRAARVLADGQRDMVDEEEWEWIAEHTRGAYDHLIIASTLPVFMTPGIDAVEAWNEAVCAGAWGRLAARAGEKLRRALDLEHWPAFQRSFRTMVELLHELAEGPDAPGTISFIGGDVHTAYVAEVALGARQESSVFQIVCSPFRNPLEPRERRVIRLLQHAAAGVVCRALGARGRRPPARRDVAVSSRRSRSTTRSRCSSWTSAARSSRSGAARPRRADGWPLEPILERDLTPKA